jgi:hypothetical protein
MNNTVVGLAIILYNLTLIVGTTYVVIEYNWSMWTYLLTLTLMLGLKTTKDEKNES